MNLDEQIERAKEAVELSKKRTKIGKEMEDVQENRVSSIKVSFSDWINTLDGEDLEIISNLTYELLSKKYEAISEEIEVLLTPKQQQSKKPTK